jgi:hypothetical protein
MGTYIEIVIHYIDIRYFHTPLAISSKMASGVHESGYVLLYRERLFSGYMSPTIAGDIQNDIWMV